MMKNKKISLLLFSIIFIILGALPIFSAKAQGCTNDVDIVFINDTSMIVERFVICDVIDKVVDNLEEVGFNINYRVYALSDTLSTPSLMKCEQERLLSPNPCGLNKTKDWGWAVEDKAQSYPWRAGAARIIIPISKEGPYCGDPCDGNDTTSINNAIAAANVSSPEIFVFPMLGLPPFPCADNMMDQLVNGTNAQDKKILPDENPGEIVNDISEAIIKTYWDSDGDGYIKAECPCNPADLPSGIIGCWDCDDSNSSTFHECLYGGLVPCGRAVDDPNTSIDERAPCSLCHIFILIKRIVDFGTVNILIPLAILMVVIGGIMFLTAGGDPGRLGSAKKILTATLIGLVIVLAAWLIVNTIITFMTPASSPFQSWHTINCPVGTACAADGCNGNCPAGCTVAQDPDCKCQDNNGCCGIGCNNIHDNNCPITSDLLSALGDINRDCVINSLDAIALAGAFGSHPDEPKWDPAADLNKDSVVDTHDALIIQKISVGWKCGDLLTPANLQKLGDSDSNCVINVLDAMPAPDLDLDGVADNYDGLILKNISFGLECTQP